MKTQTFLSPVLLTFAVALTLPACNKSDTTMEKSTESMGKKVDEKKDMLKPEMADKDDMAEKEDMADKDDMAEKEDMADKDDVAEKKKMDDKGMEDDEEDEEGGW